MEARTLRIGSDELEVELLPGLGARLHRLRAFGHDLLRTPDDPAAYDREPFFWGGFVMAPWCNRIAARPTVVADRTVAVPATFADGTAIHGQVQALAWEVVGDGRLRVSAGGDGWPWPYLVEQRIAIHGSRLQLALRLTNGSDAEMPAGIGVHPWFLQPLDIRVPAGRVVTDNRDGNGRLEPVSGPYDLRERRPMPDDLDATWNLTEEAPVELWWPRLGLHAELRARGGAYVCMASPSNIGAVAIEPQTHAPRGLRRLLRDEPGALARLAPGASLELDIELRIRRDG